MSMLTNGLTYRYQGVGSWRGPFGVVTSTTSTGREGLVAGEYHPDATTTGVPDGLALTTYNDAQVIIHETYIANNGGRDAAGRFVFENFDFPDGRIAVTAPDVTVRRGRCHVATGTDHSEIVDWTASAATGGLLEDVTLTAADGFHIDAGVKGTQVTVSRVLVDGCVDGFMLWDNSELLGSICRNLQFFDPDPFGVHDDGTHNDGLQLEGVGACRVIGNDLAGVPGLGTAAFLATQNVGPFTSLEVRANWFSAGNANANFAEKGKGTIPLTFVDNVCTLDGAGAHVASDPNTWSAATKSGNVGDGGSLQVYIVP